MAYYHASQVKDIEILKPHISNHKVPLVYFSDKRENVLVYLSNAVEKFCKEQNFKHEGTYSKWGPYGFEKDGRLRFEEYYPNALEETYRGVSGIIYSCKTIHINSEMNIGIPNAYVSSEPEKVDKCEYIEDACEELLSAEREGLITIVRYDEFIKKKKDWLDKVIKQEYLDSESQPEYRFFLEKKFIDIDVTSTDKI